MKKENRINIDPKNVANMKCYCGCDVFQKVFNLKYLSPILVGDPKGGSITIFQFQCVLCKQLYPTALNQSDIQKIYNSLPPERKKAVKDLRQKIKNLMEYQQKAENVVQSR